MQLFDLLRHLLELCPGCLYDHEVLLVPTDLAFPPVDRGHSWNQVAARRQVAIDQIVCNLVCYNGTRASDIADEKFLLKRYHFFRKCF
jgi:hypothetical protein